MFILLSIVKVYTFCVTNTYSPFGGPGRSLAAIDDVIIMDIPDDSRWLADTVGLWMGRGRLQQWSWPHHGAPCPVNSDHWPLGSCGHISNDPTRMPTLPAKSKLKIMLFFFSFCLTCRWKSIAMEMRIIWNPYSPAYRRLLIMQIWPVLKTIFLQVGNYMNIW